MFVSIKVISHVFKKKFLNVYLKNIYHVLNIHDVFIQCSLCVRKFGAWIRKCSVCILKYIHLVLFRNIRRVFENNIHHVFLENIQGLSENYLTYIKICLMSS